MDEVLKFEGSRVQFEFSSRRPGLTTMRAVYRGQVVKRPDLPGDPTPLAENLRARAPLDLMTLATKMAA
jgi:hypothetical protein